MLTFLCSLKLFFGLYFIITLYNDFLKQIKDLIQTTEVMLFIEEVYLSLSRHSGFWKIQLTQLTLQLLCVCEVSLKITGECTSLIHLLEHGVELLKEVRIVRNLMSQLSLKWVLNEGAHLYFIISKVCCCHMIRS